MIDWFFSWVDRFLQSFVWESILSNFKWVDWLTILVLILGLIYGIKKGLLREIVEILEAVFIIFIVFSQYKKVAFFLGEYFSFVPQGFTPLAAFTVLTLPLWILVAFLDGRLTRLFHTKTIGPIRIIGGALLGCFHLLLLWSFISQPLLMMPFPRVRRVYEEGSSYTGDKVRKFAPRVYVSLTEAMKFWAKTS